MSERDKQHIAEVIEGGADYFVGHGHAAKIARDLIAARWVKRDALIATLREPVSEEVVNAAMDGPGDWILTGIKQNAMRKIWSAMLAARLREMGIGAADDR